MSDNITKIADLLPEGVTEETIDQIAGMVDSVITEEVERRVKVLETKTQAFIRAQVDLVKEQALHELELENEFVRNARIAESIKTAMALEISSGDETNAISEAVKEAAQVTEENTLLVNELSSVLEERNKLQNANKLLLAKLKQVNSQRASLNEEKEDLESSLGEFNSSERAIVVSEELGTAPVQIEKENNVGGNEFITEDTLKLIK